MERRRHKRPAPLLRLLTFFLLASPPLRGQDDSSQQQRREESEDYFTKWLNEDVRYIITPEERAVFEKLTTDDERQNFIEQFWRRRDPDPRTAANEFKTEHYRRLAYVNEHFGAGWPGWRTDRGRIYIIHGPPDEIEANPSGGEYQRTLVEGGGSTSVYPFERWRYREIKGLGANIVLEFVDKDFSGLYKLALSPDEKDAFTNVPNMGFTTAEELGLSSRTHRPYFAPFGSPQPLSNYRAQDTAFARYETFVDVQRPLDLKYSDLKQFVLVDLSFQQVPVTAEVDVFRLNPAKAMAPATVEVQNSDLTYQKAGSSYNAKMAIYGVVTDVSGRLVTEFEDEVVSSFAEGEYQRGLQQRSAYNRMLWLEPGRRYKLQIVVKDLNSGNVGTTAKSIIVPPSLSSEEELAAGTVVVSGYIAPVADPNGPDQMFVVGDVRVRPSLTKEFSASDYFAVYWQVYNVTVDQATERPDFEIRYSIERDGRVIREAVDETGESVQYFSPARMVLIKRLSLEGLEPGSYKLVAGFQDRIADRLVQSTETFKIR